MPWRQRCLELVEEHGLDGSWADVLRAFEGPPGDLRELPTRIASTLAEEVDADQAALFSRRFSSVRGLLATLDRAEARILEHVLGERAAGILEAPGPRALRIRALVDYVFGRSALLVHERPDAPTAEELVARARWSEVAPGVRHATVAGPTRQGPVHLNLLRLRGVRLTAIDARDRGDPVVLAADTGATALFSGGFFLYSEPDIEHPARRGDPVGLLVHDGHVRGWPVFRRSALIQDHDGAVRIDRIGPEDARWTVGGRSVRPTGFVQRADAEVGPDQEGLAVASGRVVARGRRLPVPLAGLVLLGVDGEVGSEVRAELPGVRTAMAGGPTLVGPDALDLVAEQFAGSAPPLTFSRDETYDTNLLPRMAVGLRGDELIVLAVDGRDLDRAPGLTLRSTGALLTSLGCERATNLDGGSSKRMVVRGRVVDLATTEVVAGGQTSERVRPLHTAVLVHEAG
ncbi:MAG: phosphodiester glycosidase family protein [Alphaproteobacteria bacterium]|nr:phosphodiester glycosidase family protein [Alphaproteobacteria bacterium]MCB9695720.1 phosphodiester glycosidase family protein [Alphaproteobacteria bacterium]